MKASFEEFKSLCERLGCSYCIGNVYQAITKAYSGRAYHNLNHISYCLDRLWEMEEEDKHRGKKFAQQDWDELRYALWFHDFHKNEAESAAEALRNLTFMKSTLTPRDCLRIYKYVMATAHKKAELDYECQIIADVDLSVLGSTPEVYKEYTEKVRKEYSEVPLELYCKERYKVMKPIYDRPKIYMTEYGRRHWQMPAMRNLGKELEELSKNE